MHHQTTTRRAGALAVACLLGLLVAGCGDDDETASAADDTGTTAREEPAELRSVLVRAGFTLTANTESIFLAQENGYFAEEGLEVDIREGNGSGAVIQLIGQGGDAEIGWAIDSGTAALNISKGVPVKIAQINKRKSPFGTTCFPDVGFDDPKDLEGHSVLVVPGESTAAIFPAYLAINGVDESKLKVVNTDAPTKVALFASGQAECMIGYANGDNLQASIANDEIPAAIPWSDQGVKLLGDGVVASAALVEDEPEVVAGFLRAVRRGWADMCADVEGSIESFNERNADLYTDSDREYVRRTMPLECEDVKPADGRPAFSPVTEEEWSAMVDILHEYGGLDEVLPMEEYFTGIDVPVEER